MIHTREEPATFADVLAARAADTSICDEPAFSFLTDGEREDRTCSYRELEGRAREIAGRIRRAHPGNDTRLLMVYPPGLEFIESLFGCFLAGVTAVPAYPPDPSRLAETLPRLQGIAADSGAAALLTTDGILALREPMVNAAPGLGQIPWIATDRSDEGATADWSGPAATASNIAILQYTSGSTAAPKGVMVSHANLVHNTRLIFAALKQQEGSTLLNWLPLFHDMGLIASVLAPVYHRVRSVQMSPLDFVRRPMRWLRAISRYRATISGGPNFAYEMCIRRGSRANTRDLDLSSWEVAFTGAEPIRTETLDRFAEIFEPCGFRRESLRPCYGLAESTLMATCSSGGRLPRIVSLAADDLERGRAVDSEPGQRHTRIVGCGTDVLDQLAIVVDPDDHERCAPDRVGEIWLAGPSVALGYWNRPEETEQTFHARLRSTAEGPFLRTGDLGFKRDGELFVTGRIKDMIVIRGLNHYPQDLELSVESSHTAVRSGGGAAFAIEVGPEERTVIVCEVHPSKVDSAEQVVRAAREAVHRDHGVACHDIVLLEPSTLPKTSSGKIQRHLAKAHYLGDELAVFRVAPFDGTVARTPDSARVGSAASATPRRDPTLPA